MDKEVRDKINRLLENAETVYVASVDGDGFPNVKCMFACKHEGISTHYMSTNYSAMRTGHYLENAHACVYFCNEKEFMGLMLVGMMEVCTDQKHREMLWKEGDTEYYPQGVDDPDYCVLKFNAIKGKFYNWDINIELSKEELEG